MKPISPTDAIIEAQKKIPDEVIEIFNELIVTNWGEGPLRAIVYQEDVVQKITKKLDCERRVVFDNGWLNVEGIFRKVGWKVNYDKPGIGDNYRAHYIFKK